MQAETTMVSDAALLDWLRQETLRREATGDAMTMAEIVEATRLPEERVRKMLKQMMIKGQLECVWVPRLALDGRYRRVPAYRLRTG